MTSLFATAYVWTSSGRSMMRGLIFEICSFLSHSHTGRHTSTAHCFSFSSIGADSRMFLLFVFGQPANLQAEQKKKRKTVLA